MQIYLLPIVAVLLTACTGGGQQPGGLMMSAAETACVLSGARSCLAAWPAAASMPELEAPMSEGEYWMLTGPQLVNWAQDMIIGP